MLAALDASLPRYVAVAAYLHERDGDLVTGARLYAEAAQKASNLAERDHLTRQSARAQLPPVLTGRARIFPAALGAARWPERSPHRESAGRDQLHAALPAGKPCGNGRAEGVVSQWTRRLKCPVKVTHLRRFGCPKSGSPRLI